MLSIFLYSIKIGVKVETVLKMDPNCGWTDIQYKDNSEFNVDTSFCLISFKTSFYNPLSKVFIHMLEVIPAYHTNLFARLYLPLLFPLTYLIFSWKDFNFYNKNNSIDLGKLCYIIKIIFTERCDVRVGE